MVPYLTVGNTTVRQAPHPAGPGISWSRLSRAGSPRFTPLKGFPPLAGVGDGEQCSILYRLITRLGHTLMNELLCVKRSPVYLAIQEPREPGARPETFRWKCGDLMQQKVLREQFTAISDAWALAQGIVDTVREPVLVLDKELRVITASRSFYSGFKVSPKDTQGRLLYALGDGQWDIPKLRVLLEKIIPEKGVMEGYEVEHEFPNLGQRTMCLNARQVFYEGSTNTTILLGMEDITDRRNLEREKDELLRQKEVL